ncbi:MAG: hypothetical protein HOQ05_04775 [Corynebacteriales bacterium]|nr:hypothetical protein [Mycobacteriales bacterium]
MSLAGCGAERAADFKGAYLFNAGIAPDSGNDSFLLLTADEHSKGAALLCSWLSKKEKRPSASVTTTVTGDNGRALELEQWGDNTLAASTKPASCVSGNVSEFGFELYLNLNYGKDRKTSSITLNGLDINPFGDRIHGFSGQGAQSLPQACDAIKRTPAGRHSLVSQTCPPKR